MADEVVSLLRYTPKPGIQVCPYCEVENSPGKRFCFVCGADLSKPLVREEPVRRELDSTATRPDLYAEPEPMPKKKPIVKFLLISIFIVLCILLVYVISQNY